ncbi:hypothetical protein B0H21DRAFT_766027 [Amylocystis lapponica]|nr:hypothetical protein B0H21DRAFT_766027 [Amylocystis lapponica]
MEVLQTRIDSYLKSKRTKPSKYATKWPHPSTYKANPRTLAEAGFFFDPSPDDKDNVTCFMCGKELSAWDEDDDPFNIHWSKCKDSCAWAIVRCGIVADVGEDGSYDFSDPARQPGGKLLEKARLETFTTDKSWPHDSVKGHGASSKKMAKAGFVYTPQHIGDDTATCVYCNLSLSGWVEDDDPTDEHMKREKKSGVPCAFFQQPATRPLASPPRSLPHVPHRNLPHVQPPGRAVKTSMWRFPSPAESDDELAKTRGSKSSGSRASAATVVTKTPGGKTPDSRATAGSDIDETEVGSGSDAGKRVSKTKRKAPVKAQERIEVIEEEEEDPPAEREEEAEAHARTRSRMNVDTESDAPGPSSSKLNQSRTRSASKGVPSLQESVAGTGTRSRKKTKEDEIELRAICLRHHCLVQRAKVIVSDDEGDVSSGEEQKQNDHVAEKITNIQGAKPAAKKKGKQRESTPTASDDAGYATPEPQVDPEPMEVDNNPQPTVAPNLFTSKAKSGPNGLKPSTPLDLQPTPFMKPASTFTADVAMVDVPPSSKSGSQPASKPVRKVSRTGTASLSRTSSATDASYRSARMSRDKLKVVEISSDDEIEKPPAPALVVKKSKAVKSEQLPIHPNGRKDMQVEIAGGDEPMIDPKHLNPVALEVDQEMEERPANPSTPPRPMRHLSPIPQIAPRTPPSRDDEEKYDQQDEDGSFTPFIPYMLRAMSVEQYVRRDLEQRRLAQLRERAAEARRMIEAA